MPPMTLRGVPEVTAEEIDTVADGNEELTRTILVTVSLLHMDARRVGIFCRNTPGGKKGDALWREFTERVQKNATNDYSFEHFMQETIAEAGYPIG